MHLDKRVWRQLMIFAVIAVVAGGLMVVDILHVPSRFFGVGEYRVTISLPASAGLYQNAAVNYRGTQIGRVDDVRLTPAGVDAVMSLNSDVRVPADLQAQVHSQNAVGEQYVELLPHSGDGPALKDQDVIPQERVSIPPDINKLLTATNRGLQAIPNDNLRTAINEAYTAFGGLGPELSRIVKGTTRIAVDARANLDSITSLIDRSKPVLETQIDSSDSIQQWAANIAQVTGELETQDSGVRGILRDGPGAADETRQLLDRLQPTLPVLLTNLVSLADVAITYQPNIEQLLVLVPQGIQVVQGASLADRDTKQDYRGLYLSFNLNLNLPPPCTTGFMPAQQQRQAADVDFPEPPDGDVYCRVPQDSALAVRGARNIPCASKPGKRAPTAAMCESDENYVPLNDGYNWKGDPNATLSGQSVPQPRTGTPGVAQPPADPLPLPAGAAPPIAAAIYDPATGIYIGPDGKPYTQSNLAPGGGPSTWQDMLTPPKGP